MKTFAFFGHVPELDLVEQKRLEILWADSWSKAGFEPMVLSEWHAQQHPQYNDLATAFLALPSVNPKPYDYLCFIRYVAMAMAPVPKGELFLMVDSDVMCFDPKPFLHYGNKAKKDFTRLVSYQGYVPACVLGTRQLFEEQALRFAAYKLEPDDLHDTTPHISDQNILCKQCGRDPESFVRLDVVKSYTEPGWEQAPAVHYANSACGPNKKTPRSTHIPLLRPF